MGSGGLGIVTPLSCFCNIQKLLRRSKKSGRA